ncbi:MAG TPA: ATP-dependent DNA helicase RecG [Accumulibacter sp.]|nr:ATP-dependent DNA helicase RecG [Accumulibacter sp.]
MPAAAPLRDKLRKLGLERRLDLVLHLPLRYDDETKLSPLVGAPLGEPLQVEVTIVDISLKPSPRRQLLVTVVEMGEGGGVPIEQRRSLVLRFLSFYGSQLRAFELARDQGRHLRVFGELREGFFGLEMVHPRYRVVEEANDDLPVALTPVYPTTAGLSQTALRRLIGRARRETDLSEILDPAWCAAHDLPLLAEALTVLHAPPSSVDTEALNLRAHPAWRRVKFDELLAQQLSLRRAYLARRCQTAPRLRRINDLTDRLQAMLPFVLTAAQQRTAHEIARDLEQPYPMQRLLQGDVGSGKTIVAALAACQAIAAGYQVAFMAPTEILAEQHFLKLRSWLAPLDIEVIWLSGRQRQSAKRLSKQQAASSAQLIVGTHALIQEALDFARLGLAIVDEQHRFGVLQRLELRRKGSNPHQLMMSATPIPRTLAMSYYADLDVSTIDELPPGRTPVRTRLFAEHRRAEVIARLRQSVARGRQAYWVCPLIEESPKLELQAALDTHATLSGELPELRIGLVHGRLKSADKAATMAAFVAGDIDLLVATTVIEVGVDVANASLMVIEHAERFGLSQLHQLRGRVGRGTDESVCVLLYQSPLSDAARARLKIIFQHHDGFEISRQDLLLRGPGEFVGSRQSGAPLLRYADLNTDGELVELAQRLAERLLHEDPDRAARHLQRWLGRREELLRA